MKKKVLSYDIHNIIEFKILVESRKLSLMRILNHEYSFFEVAGVDDPDIILNIDKFIPSNDDCYVVDDKYYIKENYFYCKDSEGRAKWEMEIFGFEKGKTMVNLNFNISGVRAMFSGFAAQIFLLRSLVHYKLGTKSYFLIHSAGISKNGQTYLFAGRGGAFKTTLAMDFVRKAKFDFLGDENVMIYDDKVLPYLSTIASFSFRCKYMPTEELHNILDRMRQIIYYWRYMHTKTKDEQIYVANSSKLKALFLITRKNSPELAITENSDLDNIISKLITNEKMEISILPTHTLTGVTSNHYLNYMLAYSFIFPDSQVATYWGDMRKGLKEVLKDMPIYVVEVPYKYSTEVFDKIYEQIKEIE